MCLCVTGRAAPDYVEGKVHLVKQGLGLRGKLKVQRVHFAPLRVQGDDCDAIRLHSHGEVLAGGGRRCNQGTGPPGASRVRREPWATPRISLRHGKGCRGGAAGAPPSVPSTYRQDRHGAAGLQGRWPCEPEGVCDGGCPPCCRVKVTDDAPRKCPPCLCATACAPPARLNVRPRLGRAGKQTDKVLPVGTGAVAC